MNKDKITIRYSTTIVGENGGEMFRYNSVRYKNFRNIEDMICAIKILYANRNRDKINYIHIVENGNSYGDYKIKELVFSKEYPTWWERFVEKYKIEMEETNG